ncbi:MAG: hypothetical protein K6B75_02800 [Lachnospiraceae bacterium]|nr:hypothetical protein [Lachnospiraceae bacterium]
MLEKKKRAKAYYHLPGLFEFYDFYSEFLPIFYGHREYFYDWCEIGSVYGAPGDCLWGGGRVGFGDADPKDVAELLKKYGISARLTFSNSLLKEEHLADKKCNRLCRLFSDCEDGKNGIIIYSDLLLEYIKKNYPGFYFVSTTTKVLTDFSDFEKELEREDFSFVVPDFRLNKSFEKLEKLPAACKDKTEFLCNECCSVSCKDRKKCYENVSKKAVYPDCEDHACTSLNAARGYRFSDAMKSPAFIGIDDIKNIYLPMGFSQFKIEGRSLGSAILLEFILHYMTKPEYAINLREELYLDSTLDLF